MTLVAGIDPGVNGAIAIYDNETRRIVSVYDMPSFTVAVGKKQRTRIDEEELRVLLESIREIVGVELVVLESVGGRPGQSAPTAYQLGYVVGCIRTTCSYCKFIIEPVIPGEWKKMLKIPGKKAKKNEEKSKKDIQGAIIRRVQELFPLDHEQFAGPRGGYRMDQADAALLAKFGGDFVWPSLLNNPHLRGGDEEYKLIYRRTKDALIG